MRGAPSYAATRRRLTPPLPRRISTGLDSAVTFDIVKSLKARATSNGLGVVIALLQPTPEVYDLFDEVRGGVHACGGRGRWRWW